MEDLRDMDNKRDHEYDAKMAVLEELRDLAKQLMSDKLGDRLGKMQEVSVQAPDKKGLSEGLDMAKDVLGEKGSRSIDDPMGLPADHPLAIDGDESDEDDMDLADESDEDSMLERDDADEAAAMKRRMLGRR